MANKFEYNDWYSDLPVDVAKKVCTCLTKAGWSRNPETEHWVCGNCRKPSRYCSTDKCVDCDKYYYQENALDRKYEPICPECSSEGENSGSDDSVKFGSKHVSFV